MSSPGARNELNHSVTRFDQDRNRADGNNPWSYYYDRDRNRDYSFTNARNK